MHCPTCGAEYRAGYTICTDDFSMLELGPPPQELLDGLGEETGIEVVRSGADLTDREDVDPEVSDTADGPDEPDDLFAQEELMPERVALGSLLLDEALELAAQLEQEDIGVRLSEPDANGTVEIVVHDFNLPTAQAIALEHAGDLLVLPVTDERGEDESDGYVKVASVRAFEAGSQAARLRDAGIPVRVEFPEGEPDGASSSVVTLWVPNGSLADARKTLGIAV